MKTGIFGYKGHVHYHCGTPVNQWIDELANLPKNEFFTALSQRIDSELHQYYRLYPSNFIALDELNGNTAYADNYSKADKQRFDEYLNERIAKVELDGKDEVFLRERILTMYANPAINKMKQEKK